ncbi:hypothetical protein BDP27DRAFT_1419250 [Rhodocollybia butyracea]|uniref:4Fe-4S ferredoxin-type domain-containing protein n=1 Tax=Rhodocollybia butyracea TaxID=206335 RepID=A0A9P5PY35_9AGAR|nr:hypothetical protein BDP27DRAFT_1419250 [Rhodocollybia butyracea]
MLVSGLPTSDSGRPMKRSRNWASSSLDQYQDSSQYDFQANSAFAAFDMPRQDRPDPPQRDKNPNRTLSLKLKCDRNFPCQSCRKRGCGDICPEGALTSGRGSRFILANTGQLHGKISQLSERVRYLEDVVKGFNEHHPSLSPELLRIKTIQEFYGVSSNASSSSTEWSQRDSENLHQAVTTLSLTNENTNHYMDENGNEHTKGPPDVPPDVVQLSATFPFPWAVDLKIRKRIRDSLPPRQEAEKVCKEAQGNALWQYNLDASETFLSNLLHHCYETSIEDLSPRRLALLLMVLSIGSLVDLNKPLGNLYGEAYHHLARASVCEIPLMEEPDFDTLHALFFMIWYHLIFSDNKKAVGYAWNLMGFVAKLAQGLGLHREGRNKMIPEEHAKRRHVFWELLNLDCRMSLSLGRPPSICLAHVDIQPPDFSEQGLSWMEEPFFHRLFITYSRGNHFREHSPYERTVELDSIVRRFNVPDLLKEEHVGNDSRFLVMQRALVSTGRDIALLQLHRRPFMELLSSPEQFDWNNKLAPSVLATYLGCSSIIAAVETLFEKEEQLSGRFLCFWFNVFSASVTLSLFVSREPSCALAPCALADLDRVCRLFERAAKILPFCARTLPVIEKNFDKSRRAYWDFRHHQVASVNGGNMNANTHEGLTSIASSLQGAGPYFELPQSFSMTHYSLIQRLQDLLRNPPVVPVSPPPLRSLPVQTSMISGMGSLSLDSLGLAAAAAQQGYQPLASQGVSGTYQQEYELGGGSGSTYMHPGHPSIPPRLPYLPNIYSFSSGGIGVEDRYSYREVFASAPPTPFMPSSPRVGEDEVFNLDHGALTTHLEETSYMAWF